MSASKFETCWTLLNECPYELPSELKPFLQKAIEKAGFYESQTVVVETKGETQSSGAEKKKALTGYNVFTKEKMAELKSQDVPSSERMSKVGAMWKALAKEKQEEYKVKAQGLASQSSTKSAVTTKSTEKKKLTGYNLFTQEKMAVVKLDAGISATERMGAIGKLWKALPKEKQAEYTVKAKAV